jgi:hypothetical protein
LISAIEDPYRLSVKEALDKRGDHPPILNAHKRSIGVKDPGDVDMSPRHPIPPIVDALIGVRQCLHHTLSLIIARALSIGVRVSKVSLRLGRYERISVHFGGGGNQDVYTGIVEGKVKDMLGSGVRDI